MDLFDIDCYLIHAHCTAKANHSFEPTKLIESKAKTNMADPSPIISED